MHKGLARSHRTVLLTNLAVLTVQIVPADPIERELNMGQPVAAGDLIGLQHKGSGYYLCRETALAESEFGLESSLSLCTIRSPKRIATCEKSAQVAVCQCKLSITKRQMTGGSIICNIIQMPQWTSTFLKHSFAHHNKARMTYWEFVWQFESAKSACWLHEMRDFWNKRSRTVQGNICAELTPALSLQNSWTIGSGSGLWLYTVYRSILYKVR